MTRVESLEFEFVNEIPKRELGRLARLWKHFEEVRALTKEHGMLVPAVLAAELSGVSRQRMFTLMEEGKLPRVDVGGRPFIPEDALLAWAKSERRAGRPTRLDTPRSKRECDRLAMRAAKVVTAELLSRKKQG